MSSPETCRVTGKRRYTTDAEARRALRELRHGPRAAMPSHERRAYRCPMCHGWHLTAKLDAFRTTRESAAATKSARNARKKARRAIAKIHAASTR